MPNDQTPAKISDRAAPMNPIVAFKRDLTSLKKSGEFDMLPSNVSFEAFQNAAVVAVTDNPQILNCDRTSVFKALRRIAGMGLVPDGREAAIVPYSGQAQAMPMRYGVIKTIRNSGQVSSIWSEVVYEGEEFTITIEEGERWFSHKFDALDRPEDGLVKGAYAVAKMKDGTIEFVVMGRSQIEKRRKVSKTQKGAAPTGVWAQWYDEMAKKTAIHALAKNLPVSPEDLNRLQLLDDEPDKEPVDITPESEVIEQQQEPESQAESQSKSSKILQAIKGDIVDAEEVDEGTEGKPAAKPAAEPKAKKEPDTEPEPEPEPSSAGEDDTPKVSEATAALIEKIRGELTDGAPVEACEKYMEEEIDAACSSDPAARAAIDALFGEFE